MSIERIRQARSKLLIYQPFFGVLSLSLKLNESDKPQITMDTDGTELRFNPAWVASLQDDHLMSVLAHEVIHVAMKHHMRRGIRNAERWNEATDYVVNNIVLDAGFHLPPDAKIDRSYKGMAAEEVYDRIKEKEEEKKKQQQAKTSGAPNNGPKELEDSLGPSWGAIRDAPEDTNEEDLNTTIQNAANAGKAAGKLPGFVEVIVEAAKREAIDWEPVIRRFIDDKIMVRETWSRPNRRFSWNNLILPTNVSDGVGAIGVVIDTSGSVKKELLDRYISELKALFELGKINRLVMLTIDTEIRTVQEFTSGEDIIINGKGRGGTRFSPAFRWFTENEPDVRAIIYFTDLICSDFGPEPDAPVLWAVHGHQSDVERRIKNTPFGEVVHII